MKFTKYPLLLILATLLIGFAPELSAKSHHRKYHKSSKRTSLAMSLNVNAGTPVYQPAPVYYTAPSYYQPTYTTTTVVRQYPQQAYYEQLVVSQPMPVQQVVVQQPQARPSVGFSISPFFSFWSN